MKMSKPISLKIKEIILAVFGGLFLTFSRYIFSPFVINFDYSLLGLRLYDPNFILKDWFVWKVPNTAYAFGYLLYFLQKIGPLKITAAIAQTAVLILLSLALMILTKRFCKYPLIVFLMLIVWLRIVNANEIGLGGQYFIKGFLQPLEVAGPLMILGLALLLNYKYLLSGVVLGLAGLFHGAYLTSFGPAIFATSLAVGVWKKKKSLILFILPLFILWGIFVCITGNTFIHSKSVDKNIMSIMINLRAAGDFMIANWSLKWNLAWVFWASLGTTAILILPKGVKFKQLKVTFFTLLITNIIGVLQLIFLKIPTLTLMMFWRSSFFVLILGLMIVLDKAIDSALKFKIDKADKLFLWTSLFLFIGLSLISWGPHISRIHFLWLSSIPMSAFMAFFAKKYLKNRFKKKSLFFMLIYAGMIAIMLVYLNGYFGKTKEFLSGYSPALISMQKWIKSNTPENAIFVIPPDIIYMRTRARRAIVVDWLSIPYFPKDLKEWYQRLSDISGTDSERLAPNLDFFAAGYRNLDFNRAIFLKDRYGANFLVVEKDNHVGNLSGLIEIFSNEEYRIFKIP